MEPDITRVVRESVADTLGLDPDAVATSAAVVTDLGAESIELVDILFRIECATGTRLSPDDVGALLQGDVDDDAFLDARGGLTGAGRAQLARVLSAPTAARVSVGLRPDQISALLTVDDLAGLVRALLATSRAARPCLVR
jgi:acyl carrier protein